MITDQCRYWLASYGTAPAGCARDMTIPIPATRSEVTAVIDESNLLMMIDDVIIINNVGEC